MAEACFSLYSIEKGSSDASTSISIPITWAELEVMRSILRYSIPYYLGFHEVWGGPGGAVKIRPLMDPLNGILAKICSEACFLATTK